MKRIVIISFIVLSLPVLALVWEEDPSISEEERQERRELNQRIREKNLMGAQLEGSARVARPMPTDEDGIPYWDIGGPGTGTPSARSDDASSTNDEPDYSDED